MVGDVCLRCVGGSGAQKGAMVEGVDGRRGWWLTLIEGALRPAELVVLASIRLRFGTKGELVAILRTFVVIGTNKKNRSEDSIGDTVLLVGQLKYLIDRIVNWPWREPEGSSVEKIRSRREDQETQRYLLLGVRSYLSKR